jgi:hypothetical protein
MSWRAIDDLLQLVGPLADAEEWGVADVDPEQCLQGRQHCRSTIISFLGDRPPENANEWMTAKHRT